MRAVHRAAEIAGGITFLAVHLDASPLSVAAWMEGTSEVPAAAFLRIVEIIVDGQCAPLRGAIPTSDAEFRYREAANS